MQNSAAQMQSHIPQLQQSYTDVTAALSSTANDLSTIVTAKDISYQEKATRLGKEVQDRVTPLLDVVKRAVSEVLSRANRETKVNGVPPAGNGSAR